MAALAPRPKILVVDDEPIIAQLITDVLSGDGYDVDVASDGLIALEHIDRDAYDLILSDLRMPGLDGLGLYRQLEQHRPELARRFVFITGDTANEEAWAFLEGAQVPVIEKPFQAGAFEDAVARVMPPDAPPAP